MTGKEKALRKAIAHRFSGLSERNLEKLTEYYFTHLGGADGCEECYEGKYLCGECEQELMSEAYKLVRGELL